MLFSNCAYSTNIIDENGNKRLLHIPSYDDILLALKERAASYEAHYASVSAENERLKSENYKDEELQWMKKQMEETELHYQKLMEDYGRGFRITKEEQEKIDMWKKAHIKKKHNGNSYAGAIGGNWTYKFTPTGIGTLGEIKCSCGETFCFCDIG
jgi:hypothetical protein